ncbi:MAG TPA: hypothetical protein VFZ25_08870 [Chloroflexota bacterium]|nr:hypothetical protein [Chloroflexota bacterium]
MPRAQIVVHAPVCREEAYRFDLIDLDGPRHGQRLADFDVPAVYDAPGSDASPNPRDAEGARAKLVAYGSRNGYTVVDDHTTNPTEDPGRQARMILTHRSPARSRAEKRRRRE